MDLTSAVVLGALQGVTEFLPVSSSGHLVICQNLLGMKEPEVFFDVCLHIGSLLAVLLVFWQDIIDLIIGGVRFPFAMFKRRQGLDAQEKTFLLVVLGTIPVVILGFTARHYLESLFASVTAVSFNLLLTGAILWATRYSHPRDPKTVRRTRWQDALSIGLAQGLALAPGISRSGITISSGLYLGLDRDWAGRFSFLLFVPAVCGAFILEAAHIRVSDIEVLPTILGVVSAAIVGYFALRLLMRLVRKGNLYIFAPYCWLLGLIGLSWGLYGK